MGFWVFSPPSFLLFPSRIWSLIKSCNVSLMCISLVLWRSFFPPFFFFSSSCTLLPKRLQVCCQDTFNCLGFFFFFFFGSNALCFWIYGGQTCTGICLRTCECSVIQRENKPKRCRYYSVCVSCQRPETSRSQICCL